MIEALQKLGYYVNFIANGHLPTILNSGFPVNAATALITIPSSARQIKLSDRRQMRQVRLDFRKQKQVLVYEYMYRKNGDGKWSDRLITTSSRGNIIAPLETAFWYEIKVRAVNTKGAGNWSDTVRWLVR